MRIYLGSEKVNKAMEGEKNNDIIFHSKTILVTSTSQYLKITVNDSKTLYLWGDVYAINMPNGSRFPIDLAADGLSVIKDFFDKQDINKIIQQLEGDFVGLLIENKKEVTILCDAFNRTEVFYSMDAQEAVVATDIETVIKSLRTVTYSQIALANLLNLYGYYAPKKLTIYNEVSRLGVGERLKFRKDRLYVEQSPFEPLNTYEFSEQDHYRYAELLENAVQIRGTASGLNWVFLSSGWDSTSILSVLIKLYGPSKIRCVIGEMLYSERSGVINQFEIEKTKKFVNYFHVPLDIVSLDLRNMDSVGYWQSISPSLKKQHVYSFSAYNYYRLSEHVLKYGNAGDSIFAGEISDGAHNLGFAQFTTILEHPDLNFREYSDKMASYLFGPSFFNRIVKGDYMEDAVYKLLRGRAGSSVFDDTENHLDKTDRKIKFFASFFLRNYRLPFYGLNNTKMLTLEGANMFETSLSNMYLRDAAERVTPETLYAWLLYLYNSFFWQGGTVRCLGTRLADDGIKLKLPYWDGKIQDFLSEMPENWGRGLELKPTKYPLKWALKNKFDYPFHLQTGPHAYLYDVNPQFSHASEVLFGSHVSSHFKKILKDRPYESLLQKEYFNMDYLSRLVDEYQKGKESVGQERSDLLALVTLCLIGWY